jgi:hypothetical protein
MQCCSAIAPSSRRLGSVRQINSKWSLHETLERMTAGYHLLTYLNGFDRYATIECHAQRFQIVEGSYERPISGLLAA